MKFKFLKPLLLAIAFSSVCPNARADSDVVLDALTDEMNRTMTQLHVDQYPRPYFISLGAKQVDELKLTSCLGSPAIANQNSSRIMEPYVVIGDYTLDSSLPNTSRPNYVAPLPVDNDYAALRKAAWICLDYEYKETIRNFEWKKAYLNVNSVPDRLPEMTHEKPVVSVEQVEPFTLDEKKWADEIEKLSALCKQYPSLQKSRVDFLARRITHWFINSEGTRIRNAQLEYSITVGVYAEADDGMDLTDMEVVAANEESEIPQFEQLKSAIETLAKRTSDLRLAKKGEEYCGPVLFEGQAAAELFVQVMAPNLGMAEDYIPNEQWRNPLKDAVGRRILPNYISVTDDPRAKEFKGTSLFGGYKFDDQGVAAQKVNLIENGVLKAFCQSRLPTKVSNNSNGHSLSGHGVTSILQFSSSKTSTPAKTLEKLKDLAKDTGLDYVLVVSRMGDAFHWYEYPYSGLQARAYAYPAYSTEPSAPVVAYKLYLADGHRELVRGLTFRNVSLRAFRDIQDVGDDAAPYLVEPNDFRVRHVITPSFTVGELEFTPAKPNHTTPPLLPSPLALDH